MTRAGLEALYRATTYRVMTRPAPIDLRLGRYSADISAVHALRGVSGSVLVSACNPRGRLCSAEANQAVHDRLIALLRARSEAFVPALGIPDSGDWPAETSVLILGADRRRACVWCRLLRQNAVLWIGADAVPQLCWHRCRRDAIIRPDRCSFPAAP